MSVNRLKILCVVCVEIPQIINKLNPELMNNTFKVKGKKILLREQ